MAAGFTALVSASSKQGTAGPRPHGETSMLHLATYACRGPAPSGALGRWLTNDGGCLAGIRRMLGTTHVVFAGGRKAWI